MGAFLKWGEITSSALLLLLLYQHRVSDESPEKVEPASELEVIYDQQLPCQIKQFGLVFFVALFVALLIFAIEIVVEANLWFVPIANDRPIVITRINIARETARNGAVDQICESKFSSQCRVITLTAEVL